MGQSGTQFEAALNTVAHQLKIDPAVLLGALAAEPRPVALWSQVERVMRREAGPQMGDWQELATATEVLAAATDADVLSCWVAEPADTVEVFALASCLALAARRTHFTIVATHSDPLVAEIGRSGLLSETAVRMAPPPNRAHFRHLGRCWEVIPALRATVQFATMSPFEDRHDGAHIFAGGYDLVVSRGLLSRLGPQTTQRLAVRLVRATGHGGFLLVGSGEHHVSPLGDLERFVAPGVLLYRKHRSTRAANVASAEAVDFASLLEAVETDPTAWEPRWQLARVLLEEGHAEPAIAHLREVARRRPDTPGVWKSLAQAYTLLGDIHSAKIARSRCLPTASVANAA